MATKQKGYIWAVIGYNAQRIEPNPRCVFASPSWSAVHKKWLSLKQKARQGMRYRTQMIKIQGEQ